MMKVDKVHVSYERKFNLGDYNSLSLGATVWLDLEGEDSPEEVMAVAQDYVRDAVRREYGRLKSRVPSGQTQAVTIQLPQDPA